MENILVLGGDIRSIYISLYLKNLGKNVKISGVDSSLCDEFSINFDNADNFKDTNIIIMGLPAVKSDLTVYSPLYDGDIFFEDILKSVPKECKIFGGRFAADALRIAAKYGVKCVDYSCDEVFQIENAFYTAEGAIEAIIKNTVRSVSELNILITGYGRISRALTDFMTSLGSKVTVYARNIVQRTWAAQAAFDVTDKLSIEKHHNVIVNTVPFELFDEKILSCVSSDILFIDLSARPGYVSKEICAKYGINLVYLPGLPSVCAPCSAGEAAARAVIRMMKEGDGA